MALIQCPKCRKQFSEHASVCPQCGISIEDALLLIEKQEEEQRQKLEQEAAEREAKEAEEVRLRAEKWKKNKKWIILCVAIVLLSIIAYVFYANRSTVIASNKGDLNIFLRFRKTAHVIIPNSVTSIGDDAFIGYNGLTSVTIPNSVTRIGNSTFKGCSGLTSVTIPNSVTRIGDDAFYGCNSLTSVTIPNSVTSIGESAFENCRGLASITIPNSVTSVGYDAFYGCSSLTSPLYNAHVFAYMPESYSGSYKIPRGIKTIAGGAFRYCNLTSVTIPNSVTSIGRKAFSVSISYNKASFGCHNLASITCLAIIPPMCGPKAFSDVDKRIPVYVPASSVTVYKQASGWNDFTNIQAVRGE